MADFSTLIGKTFTSVTKTTHAGDEAIMFNTDDGSKYVMHHRQDCCESVYIEDINGDLEDLVGTPILNAYEAFGEKDVDYGIEGWTFYDISTIKGSVHIRWNGSSNGYYSIGVDLEYFEPEKTVH